MFLSHRALCCEAAMLQAAWPLKGCRHFSLWLQPRLSQVLLQVLAGQWKALQEACSEAGLDGGWLQPVHGFVDHSVCMRCSSMAVHHGGMGTMLAALEAGLPAVACPLHYDQHQNVCSTLSCSCTQQSDICS